ncbi:MAG: radical SAM protein, partial [bacterium]|nr:radical SAM protein [bacterium]
MGVRQHSGHTAQSGPRVVFWELTTGCNLRCIHCRKSAAELMSPADFGLLECCRIVDQIAQYAPLSLVLSGGEPLWRRDVFDIAKHAKSGNIRVILNTNGTLIDEVIAERIHEAGIERVAISIDGADAVTHDTFRGHQGAFDAAIRGARLLKQMGISMQINTTVSGHNAHQLGDIMKFAERLGFDAFDLFLLGPVGCGLTIPDDQASQGDEADRILQWFHDQSPDSK